MAREREALAPKSQPSARSLCSASAPSSYARRRRHRGRKSSCTACSWKKLKAGSAAAEPGCLAVPVFPVYKKLDGYERHGVKQPSSLQWSDLTEGTFIGGRRNLVLYGRSVPARRTWPLLPACVPANWAYDEVLPRCRTCDASGQGEARRPAITRKSNCEPSSCRRGYSPTRQG